MPSGEVRRVQGYEPFALDDLLKVYTEEQIITQRKRIPRISYSIDSKKCYYFPDIYIPHENKIIEVKSTWTININPDVIDYKGKATEAAGYIYELWCFNAKGERINIETSDVPAEPQVQSRPRTKIHTRHSTYTKETSDVKSSEDCEKE
jgi:hypothetical protein